MSPNQFDFPLQVYFPSKMQIYLYTFSSLSHTHIYDLFQGLLQYVCTCFSQDGSQHGGPWEIINTNYGMVTPLLLTPKKPSWACTFGEVPLTSEVTDVVILYLYSSRVQLLVLGVSGKTKFQFTLHDKLQQLSPGACLLSTLNDTHVPRSSLQLCL